MRRRFIGTIIILNKFQIIRVKTPSSGFNNNSRYSYFQETLGINVSNLFSITPEANHYTVYSRAYGLRKRISVTDNIDVIGEYKTNDIIKYRGAYIKITCLEIGDGDIKLVGEDLSSGLERRFPMTMRSMKVYVLSDKIKKRLADEKKAFLEKKKNFDIELKEMLKQRMSQPQTVRGISHLSKYQAVRKIKK